MQHDKQKILDDIRTQLCLKSSALANAAEAQRSDVAKQEGRMQTRYSTFRIEGSWLADAMQNRQGELNTEKRRLEWFVLPQRREGIGEGSLVHVRENGSVSLYFVLPCAAGYELKVGDQELLVITTQSPLAQVLLGKRPGDFVTFRDETLEICDVE